MAFDATISAVNLTSDITIYFVRHSSTNRLVTTVQLSTDIPETSHSFSYASRMDIAIAKSSAPNLESMTLYDAFNVADTITIEPTTFDNSGSLRSVLPSEELWYFDNENITQTAYTSGGDVPWTFNFSGGTPEPTKYKVTSTLENCTLTPTDTEITEGTETTFTVTANEGYQFNTVPTINGTEMTKTSDTVYTDTITVNSDVTIVATADKSITYYTVTGTLANCTRTPTVNEIAEGTETTFTVTANSGFVFNTVPTINGSNMTKVSDTEYTATITVNSNVTIMASADKIPSVYGITTTLTNCTITPTDTTVTEGTEITFTVTANEHYKFNTAPTINGTAMSKTSDTVYTTTLTVNSAIDIVANAERITCSATYDLSNATITPNDTSFNEGESVTFTATAKDGYEFNRSDYVTINGNEFTISDDKKTATATITVTGTITIYAHALIIQTHKITITGTLTHCTCNYNSGDDLVSGKAVTFTTDEGYYFNSLTPQYTVKQSSATTYETLTGALSGTGEQTFIDGSQVTLYVRNNSNINITDDITATETPIEILQGVNVYELTEENLRGVMSARFTVGTTETGTGTQTEDKEPIDFGKWITNLYYMPFATDNIINAKRSYIILGTKNTELIAKSLLSQFDIDLGTITVPNLNSSYVQENRDIKLYLPFVADTPTIGVEYSGKTLHITYHVDLIDETITVIVTDGENPVIYNKVSFGRNLPFFSTENGNTNLNYNNNGINNTIYTAFIIVTDNNVSLISNAPTDTFIRVSHIETMQTSATQEEQDLIINLLNDGVYIK